MREPGILLPVCQRRRRNSHGQETKIEAAKIGQETALPSPCNPLFCTFPITFHSSAKIQLTKQGQQQQQEKMLWLSVWLYCKIPVHVVHTQSTHKVSCVPICCKWLGKKENYGWTVPVSVCLNLVWRETAGERRILCKADIVAYLNCLTFFITQSNFTLLISLPNCICLVWSSSCWVLAKGWIFAKISAKKSRD